MSIITIGIDPHKASHTAVAVDEFEFVVDEICIRSCPTQAVLLREWADGFRDDRVWAVESAQGLGYLLAQQLGLPRHRTANGTRRLTPPRLISDGSPARRHQPRHCGCRKFRRGPLIWGFAG